jgi:hypothetical protein
MKHILKTSASIGMVFLLLYASAYPVIAQTVVDQSFTSPTNLGASINDCCAFVAQTFTAGRTGTLAGVNIDVSSTPNNPFPLHVAIHTVTGNGEPSSTILGETTLNSNSAPLSLLITFPQVINIVAGKQYAIVVNYQGAPPSFGQGQGVWSGATGNVYTGGDLYFSVAGSSWFPSSLGNHDVHFQTYVTTSAFDICLQDNSNGNRLLFNSTTGEYQFTSCTTGFTLIGVGALTANGCTITLQHIAANRRITASVDTCQHTGSASVLVVSPGRLSNFTLTDTNTANNSCVCP